MAARAAGGSMASALLNALNPIPYGRYVNYISKEDAVTRKDFENSVLSEYYTLDLTLCYTGKRINASMLYSIFGQYSDQTADAVRLSILNEVTNCKANVDFYESTGFVCLRMKELSLDEWLQQQFHKTIRGDELAAFVLSRLYSCHTMIHTAKKPWCTIMPTGQNYNYAAACDTHLLFMGNNIFSVLHHKPPPVPAIAATQIIQNATVPQHPNVPTQPAPSTSTSTNVEAANRTPEKPVDTIPTEAEVSGTNSSNNDSSTTDRTVNKPDLQHDDTSNDGSVVNLDKHPTGIHTAYDNILTKECVVKLDRDKTNKLVKEAESKHDHPSDSGMDTGMSGLSTQSHSDSDDIPLSELLQKDRGRPKRRIKRVKYEESSPGSDTDSDFQKTPKQKSKPLPRSGPSEDRLRAQKFIVGSACGKRSFVTKDSQSAPIPVRNTRSSKSVGQAVPDLNAEDGTNSSNDSSEPIQNTSKTANTKRTGSLSVTEHGLKKYKRVRKFKCKECDFVGNSRREINNHHKGTHSKCYCNTCGKACNTPSTLSRHMYSHKEDL